MKSENFEDSNKVFNKRSVIKDLIIHIQQYTQITFF